MWLSYDFESNVRDYKINGVACILAFCDRSIEIMRHLCEIFGGYLDENDCDEEGFYPINFHLFSQGKEFSSLDLFKNKIISTLGYENINKTLALFEEFKNI